MLSMIEAVELSKLCRCLIIITDTYGITKTISRKLKEVWLSIQIINQIGQVNTW